jgi:Protein NO VEIN, C-terminal
MEKKSATSRRTRQEVLPQAEWNLLDTKSLELRYNYGNSVVAEFVSGHDHADVLRELVQNEYDAGGSRLQVAFGTDELRIRGDGSPIDADGWRRLSVMLGTGQVGRSERTIAQKVNGIGSKNFGLRSLFLYGDQIYIRSGGLQTVLDFSLGTLQEPKPEPGSKNLRGIEIVVPYRKRKGYGLEPFDAVHERQALESFATDLTSVLMKLAQPKAPKSLRQVEISSERCDRFLVLKQTVAVLSQQKGITILRRAVHLDDSRLSGSEVNRHGVEEVEFQRAISLPQQYRDQAIPGYFKVRGGRIRLAVSMCKRRKKIDIKQPGHYFYPLGSTKAYTGNAVSINAPFQMNADRSQIIDPINNEFNAWLLDRAADLAFDLLTSYWWHEFGPDSYLALQKQTRTAPTYFLEKVINRLEKDPCWPTRVLNKGTRRPQLTGAAEIVVPTHPVLDGFLSDKRYLDDTLGNSPRIQSMVKECGAKTFGINSLVRLRCAGSDKTPLATRLASGEVDCFYKDFPDVLKAESLQQKFASAFDALASHLSHQNREDLKRSPTTLAADGSLQAPEKLWIVDPAIASACPIPASERLHPTLAGCKILVRLCNKYDTKKWISKTAQHVQDGAASEDQRTALYHFVLATHGHLDRQTWAILRKTQVLRDHRNDWVMPKTITLRKATGAPQLEAALHFPHPDYENDRDLAEALRFKKKVAGEDIVRYAYIVATRPNLAQEFEESLQKFSRILTKQEFEKLRTVPFLLSSRGNLASPSTLYLRTPHNVACLGDDAMFVAGPHTVLYKRLRCMEQPKVEDVLNYLTGLRLRGIKLRQPEILYPTLVEALRAGKLPTTYYQYRPIIWEGSGYSNPGDILLGNKYRHIFLQAIPMLEEASLSLRQVLRSLGVSSEPQPQHWQQLFLWFHRYYTRSGEPLTQRERYALHQAYSHLSEMPKGVTADTKCLLDQDGRLHSLTEMRTNLYLLNDDPALAQALTEKGTPLAFADIQDSQQAADLQFYHRLGISSLTEVREQIGCRIGAEIMPPPWYVSGSVIKKLHDRSFLSALGSLAAYQLQGHPDSSNAPISRLQEVRTLDFARPLHIEYQVGCVSIAVPTDVVLDHERIVIAEVQSYSELDELLSQVIASLLVRKPTEQRQLADAIYRLLTCTLPSEMEKYLTRRGIPWKPPSFLPEAEVIHSDEEFSDVVTNSLMEPETANPTLNDEELKDRQIVQEVIKSSITSRLGTSYTTSNTTFNSELKERDNNLIRFSSNEFALPPIESVIPKHLEPLEGWSPQDSNSGGAVRKGYWTISIPVDEERKVEVGQRGEEIVFLQEVDRVKRLGYSESRVVWVAKDNPFADFDILSVDENGRDLWLEVKSTTGRHGHFQWSVAELKKAMQEREQYVLWRVYEVGTTHPSIKPFRDPVGMIIRHGIQLDVASLSAEVEPLRVPD